MLAGDETTSWTDAGPCPACGDADCWLGCPEAEPADDEDDPTIRIAADDIEIGDRIDGHTVYDIAPSALNDDHLVVAVARNGVANAHFFDRTEQIAVER